VLTCHVCVQHPLDPGHEGCFLHRSTHFKNAKSDCPWGQNNSLVQHSLVPWLPGSLTSNLVVRQVACKPTSARLSLTMMHQLSLRIQMNVFQTCLSQSCLGECMNVVTLSWLINAVLVACLWHGPRGNLSVVHILCVTFYVFWCSTDASCVITYWKWKPAALFYTLALWEKEVCLLDFLLRPGRWSCPESSLSLDQLFVCRELQALRTHACTCIR